MLGAFFERLQAASSANKSLLCVGLDPEPSLIPEPSVVMELNRALVDETAGLACAYKPNLAIYESMGHHGLKALEETLSYIREVSPGTPIIGDAKRGDIGNCSLAYAHNLFDNYKFDAVTVNPYMGSDSLEPFLTRQDKGVFILCRTSNPGGKELQDLNVVRPGASEPVPLYQVVAELAKSWDIHGNVGLVIGATYPEQMRRVREACPDMTFLIPGVGPQGGDLRRTVASAVDHAGGGFLISVSRQIMYAAQSAKGPYSTGKAARARVRAMAQKLRKDINAQVTAALHQASGTDSDPVRVAI